MPAWTSPLLSACRARFGWCVTAVVLALVSLAVLPWDGAIQPLLSDWAGLPGVKQLTGLVRPFGRGEVAVLVILAVAVNGRRRLGAQLVIALVLGAVLTWTLKLAVDRMRPNDYPFAFVSGDACTAFCLVPLLARGWGWGLGVTALATAASLSRLILNYHWPTDVLCGAAVGLISGVLAAGVPLPWRICTDRRLWLALAVVCLIAAMIWAAVSPRAIWLLTFLLVFAPALVAWAAWPWLRRRLRHGWLPPAWAVAAGLAVLLTALAAGTSLWDRDEPRNALAACEMLANDAWLVPTFNGEPRLHKPILPYWLMTVVLRTGLPPELACRLPAVLAMALAVWLLGLTARRLVGEGRAVTAMLVLAGSPLVLVSGSAATTDAVLLLGLSASMWVLLRTLLDGARWWHAPVAGVAIAWALLAKGPMAVLVPLATVATVAACWRTAAGRGLTTWRTWAVLLGALAIGCVLTGLWFVPADRALDGRLWREMVLDQVLKRAGEARESHGGPFFYYLPVLLVACLAWLPALATGLRRAAGGPGLEPRPRLLLLAWFLPVLLIVSAVQTKLPHYLLPGLWPLAVLVAAGLADGHAAWWRWGRRVQAGLLGLIALALLIGPVAAAVLQVAGVLAVPLPLVPLVAPALAAGLAFALLGSLTRSRRDFAGAATLGMATLVIALALNAWRIEPYKPAAAVAGHIRAQVPLGTPIGTCGFDEPSLYFHLGPARGPLTPINGAEALRRWAIEPGPGVIVATVAVFAEAGEGLPVAVLACVPGYNYSNGKAVELLVLTRGLPVNPPKDIP